MQQILQDDLIVNKEETEELASRVLQLFSRYQTARDSRYEALSGLILGLHPGEKENNNEGEEELKKILARLPPPTEAKRFSFCIGDELPLAPEEKYKWLTCTSTHERLRLEWEALKYLLARR